MRDEQLRVFYRVRHAQRTESPCISGRRLTRCWTAIDRLHSQGDHSPIREQRRRFDDHLSPTTQTRDVLDPPATSKALVVQLGVQRKLRKEGLQRPVCTHHKRSQSQEAVRPHLNDSVVRWLSLLHTNVYRVTQGRVGRRLVANDMLLLTTTGRNTGRQHTVPLLYLRDNGDPVVIASYGGRPNHPQWYQNLLANPAATVQILGQHDAVEATTMNELERSEWWPKVVEAYADYGVYQSRTERQIPLVRLRRSESQPEA